MEDGSKVEQFLVLMRTAKGAALTDFVGRAIAEPGLFVFGELVGLESIQQLRGTSEERLLQLLELFAYGTWMDYKGQPDTFGPLNDRQQKKLKQLTMCTLAQSQKTLPYDEVMRLLDLASTRELEDFVVHDCIYPALLKCKLDQAQRCLRVQDAVPRDVRREQLPAIMASLQAWLSNINGVIGALDTNIVHMGTQHSGAQAQEAKFQEEVDRVQKTMEKTESLAQDDAQQRMMDDTMSDGLAPELPSALQPSRFGPRAMRGPAGRGMPDSKRRR